MSETLSSEQGQGKEVTKPWWSKTLWASLIVAAAPLIPPLAPVISANPEIAGAIVGAIFAALRLCTNGKVGLK